MTTAQTALWRERLNVPAYRVFEAARYARTTQQTIGNWERLRGNRAGAVSKRGQGEGRSCPGEWCNNGAAVVMSGKAGLIKLSQRRAA